MSATVGLNSGQMQDKCSPQSYTASPSTQHNNRNLIQISGWDQTGINRFGLVLLLFLCGSVQTRQVSEFSMQIRLAFMSETLASAFRMPGLKTCATTPGLVGFCLFCFYEHKIVGNVGYRKNCSQKFPRKLIVPPPTVTNHDTPNTLWASPEVLISLH